LTTKSSNRLRAIYSSDTKKLCHCVDSFSHEHYPIPLSKSMCHARSLRCFCGAPARQFVRRSLRYKPRRPTKPMRTLLCKHRPEKLNVRSGCGSERLSGSAFVPTPEDEGLLAAPLRR